MAMARTLPYYLPATGDAEGEICWLRRDPGGTAKFAAWEYAAVMGLDGEEMPHPSQCKDVWLRPATPDDDPEEGIAVPCTAETPGAEAYWEIDLCPA